ncbi:MAG: restriction endonuclease subunit S [Puniceicoccales bacterium]
MTAAEQLITENLHIWTSAVQMKSASGRGKSNKLELYGIKKLRELILELAVRGLLVPQDSKDESADTCLARARAALLSKGKGERRSAWKKSAEVTDEEQRFSLPTGWVWARVNDTGFYVNGLAFKTADWGDRGKPIIRIQNLTDASKPMNFVQGEFPEEVTVRGGDLLVSWSATLDAYIWDRDEAVLNQHIFKVGPCEELIMPRFLYWLLKVSILEMKQSEHAHGLVMTHINRGPFLAHVVAIPPIAEQSRIVAKVDELMALCDQLEQQQEASITAHQTLVQTLLEALTTASERDDLNAAWARIAEHFDTLFTTEWSIDQLKQCILQLAVMGKLVPQDPNDEPASELLKKIAAEKALLVKDGKIKKQRALPAIEENEKPFQLPEGWEWIRLGDYSYVFSGNSFKSEDFTDQGGVRVIKITNAGVGEFIETDDFLPTSFLKEYAGYRVSEGDLILALTRPYISTGLKISPCPSSYDNSLLNQRVASIRAFMDTHFLYQYMQSVYVLGVYRERFGSSGLQPNLKMGDVTNLVIPVPSEKEQKRIVAKVDELMDICDNLKSQINSAQTTQLQLADAIAKEALH